MLGMSLCRNINVCAPDSYAINRLTEAIRARVLGECDIEPYVLTYLASYPPEVQKNVVDRFLTTGLSYEVVNKTGWLVGILKAEIKASQDSMRFKPLDSSVFKKLEYAVRTKRLQADEFPMDIIGFLAACDSYQQKIVIERFLQRRGGIPPFPGYERDCRTTRTELVAVIRQELGPRLAPSGYDTGYSGDTGNGAKSDALREVNRVNLQCSLHLHKDVIQMILNVSDQKLIQKLLTVGQKAPNFLDANTLWAMLGETSLDEQLCIMQEIIYAHGVDENRADKRGEDFRVEVERILVSYGFHGFGGRSWQPPMRSKIIENGTATKFDLSNLDLTPQEWITEFSPSTKRKLQQTMRGKTLSLHLDVSGSNIGANFGEIAEEFFLRQKPEIDVALEKLKMSKTGSSGDAWVWSLAGFLIAVPLAELELTSSNISAGALAVLILVLCGGELPHSMPFHLLHDVKPPTLFVQLLNCSIRFPPSDEPWVQKLVLARKLTFDTRTMAKAQMTYQNLRRETADRNMKTAKNETNAPRPEMNGLQPGQFGKKFDPETRLTGVNSRNGENSGVDSERYLIDYPPIPSPDRARKLADPVKECIDTYSRMYPPPPPPFPPPFESYPFPDRIRDAYEGKNGRNREDIHFPNGREDYCRNVNVNPKEGYTRRIGTFREDYSGNGIPQKDYSINLSFAENYSSVKEDYSKNASFSENYSINLSLKENYGDKDDRGNFSLNHSRNISLKHITDKCENVPLLRREECWNVPLLRREECKNVLPLRREECKNVPPLRREECKNVPPMPTEECPIAPPLREECKNVPPCEAVEFPDVLLSRAEKCQVAPFPSNVTFYNVGSVNVEQASTYNDSMEQASTSSGVSVETSCKKSWNKMPKTL